MSLHTLERIAEFGALVVYRRGRWARRERLPMYLVGNQHTGRDLEEFRRRASALKWAKAQKEASHVQLNIEAARAVILAAETLLWNMPCPRSRVRMAEWQTLCAALKVAHPKVPHGPCEVCGHYGDDCTGSKA